MVGTSGQKALALAKTRPRRSSSRIIAKIPKVAILPRDLCSASAARMRGNRSPSVKGNDGPGKPKIQKSLSPLKSQASNPNPQHPKALELYAYVCLYICMCMCVYIYIFIYLFMYLFMFLMIVHRTGPNPKQASEGPSRQVGP